MREYLASASLAWGWAGVAAVGACGGGGASVNAAGADASVAGASSGASSFPRGGASAAADSSSAGVGIAGTAGALSNGGTAGAVPPGGGGDDAGRVGAGGSVLDAGTGGTSLGGAVSAGAAGGNGACAWRDVSPVTVATPFAAPDDSLTFTPPSIPCVSFPITNYGANSDAKTLDTTAFSRAIAAATAVGGGVVNVPAGRFLTGAIQLQSNIELHLEAGAVIEFSTQLEDYEPLVLTRWEGLDVMNWSPMIYALGASNVAITGSGTLQGPGESWGGGVASWKTGAASEDQRIYELWLKMLNGISGPPAGKQVPTSGIANGLRPAFVECNGCTNFMFDGPTLTNSVYWALHPLYSKNVIIRNAKIDTSTSSANGDGTDPDSCDTTLIDNVSYSTSDDIIAVKSGLNELGIAVNRPNHNLVVRNVKASLGHGFSIGSEMSGGIKNVFVSSDAPETWANLQYLLRIKTLPGRGGTIEDVFLENVRGSSLANDLYITTNYGASTIAPHDPSLIPTIKNIALKNIVGTGVNGVSMTGLPSQPLANVSFENVSLSGKAACHLVTGLNISANSSIGVTGSSCK